MLIEFRVTNFRSIKDTQILSMVANKDDLEDSRCIQLPGNPVFNLLKSIVIYGANASGKSNLIAALSFMQKIVHESATEMQEGENFNYQPFKLDRSLVTQPAEFEITFIEDKIRYQYGFAITHEKIEAEWLLVYKTQRPQAWFEREYNIETQKYTYKFSSHFSGKKELWAQSTRNNALFLSTAVQLNSEALKPIYHWIVYKLVTNLNQGINPFFSTRMASSIKGKKLILDFMNAADISIADIKITREEKPAETLIANHKAFLGDKKMWEEIEQVRNIQILHKIQDGDTSLNIFFDLSEESHGTQRLFALAEPIIRTLEQGQILIFDELESSLHPLLLRFIINQFHNKDSNPKGAQLIFTTHNSSLLNNNLFRRDQIWLVEKDSRQASRLYPLTDFSPRKNEALEKGYLEGRYGAIPFLDEFKFNETQ